VHPLYDPSPVNPSTLLGLYLLHFAPGTVLNFAIGIRIEGSDFQVIGLLCLQLFDDLLDRCIFLYDYGLCGLALCEFLLVE
jgi:hypothetical protein